MNRNLHCQTTLTEFAREFEEDQENIFSKLINKIAINYNASSSKANTQHSAETINKDSELQYDQAEKSDTSNNDLSNSAVSVQCSDKSDAEEQSDVVPIKFSQGRTPINVLKRISNIVSQKSQSSRNYKNTELHKFWMPDSTSIECYECGQKFSTFRRKHHCRLCGQIFCTRCCTIVTGKIINCAGDLKVCTYCSKVVLSYLKSPNIAADLKSDLQALQQDLTNKMDSNASSQIGLYCDRKKRKFSFGYQEEKFVSLQQSILCPEDQRNELQKSSILKSIHEEMCRTLPEQLYGEELVMFLLSKQGYLDLESNSSSDQAYSILNSMLTAGFVVQNDLDEEEEEEKDMRYRRMDLDEGYNDYNLTSNATFNERTLYKIVKYDMKMTYNNLCQLDENIQTNLVSSNKSTSEAEDNIRCPINQISSVKNSNFELSEAEKLSSLSTKPLMEAFCEYEDLIIGQQLRKENLDPNWSKFLIPLCARAANGFSSDRSGTESMDIRNYINIKKVSGGQRKESKIIGGIVLSKNIAHRDMASSIERPRILLLQCAITYQRIEGKFVSFDTLMLQEKEQISNVVTKILSLKPNIVVVHKTVSGIAQDMLRENDITLVLDVKMSVLERLARCLDCDILTSIDSNVRRPKLGTVDTFSVKSFTDENGCLKTLMCFEIPYCTKGSCILLRGGSKDELNKVKKVASFLLFVRYNWRLELSYLCNEFAAPPLQTSLFESKESSPLKEDSNVIENTRKVGDTIKTKDRNINIENVGDFSDPLRATFSPSKYLTDTSFEFSVETQFDNKFRIALSSTILSISPFISFPLPYLETETGSKCTLKKYFPNELYYSKQWCSKINADKSSNNDINSSIAEVKQQLPTHNFTLYNITSSADSREIQTLLANFRSTGSRYPKKSKMEKSCKMEKSRTMSYVRQRSIEEYVYKDVLDMENHQRVPVLFCSFYHNVKTQFSFCTQPSLLNMHFYGQNDIMLGLFLERYCFRNSYICKSCNLPMMDHIRRYVHSSGCIQVKLSEDLNKVDTETILMTSMCTICNETTKCAPMSNDTWCYSFGKYLELRFHGHTYKRGQIDDKLNCQHSLHRDYIQYFTYKGIVASFMYNSIEIWEINLPASVIDLKLPISTDRKIFVEDLKNFSVKGYEVFAKIADKLAEIASDNEDQLSVISLTKKLNRDQLQFKQCIESVQHILTEENFKIYDAEDSLLVLKKMLSEMMETWEACLQVLTTQSKTQTQKTETLIVSNLDNDNAVLSSDELINATNSSEVNMKNFDDDNKSEKKDKSVKSLLSQLLPTSTYTNILYSPLHIADHHNLKTGIFPILVNDHDLSSCIAYSLASNDYFRALENMCIQNDELGSVSECDENTRNDGNERIKSKNSFHMEIQFHDSLCHFCCKIYFAKEFDDMRKQFLKTDEKEYDRNDYEGIKHLFIRSLSKSAQWEARGGKSGSKFSKTLDDRFILKEMSSKDVSLFENFAPNYFEYIRLNQPTLLAKIFGVFKITTKKKDSISEKALLVMENLFYGREISNKFDLKGSDRNRMVDPNSQTGEIVLMDENFIQMSWTKPLYILSHSRTILREAINRDSTFLEKNGVMDYSLLVGLEAQDNNLIIGIIDYIRTYTLDKRVESIIKQSIGHGKLPTVISPKMYKARFTDAMDRYFLTVPDRWEGLSKK